MVHSVTLTATSQLAVCLFVFYVQMPFSYRDLWELQTAICHQELIFLEMFHIARDLLTQVSRGCAYSLSCLLPYAIFRKLYRVATGQEKMKFFKVSEKSGNVYFESRKINILEKSQVWKIGKTLGFFKDYIAFFII